MRFRAALSAGSILLLETGACTTLVLGEIEAHGGGHGEAAHGGEHKAEAGHAPEHKAEGAGH